MRKNKGFSLVELIVVIAIMAVLVGIIMPQFLGYVEKARAQTCKTSRHQIERQVSVMLASDVDGSFKEFLNTNYGINDPSAINKSGKDVGPLLDQINIDSDTEICKSDGEITANYYQTADKNTFIFKLVCAEHDNIDAIPLIDALEKASMKTMGSIILDMYDYYVDGKYDDINWKTEFGSSIDGYHEFAKFNGGWQPGSYHIIASDIDDFIKNTINENQSSEVLNIVSGKEAPKLYFESNEKDLRKNKVHSVYAKVGGEYYVYFSESDKLYSVAGAKDNDALRVDENGIKALVSSGAASIVE